MKIDFKDLEETVLRQYEDMLKANKNDAEASAFAKLSARMAVFVIQEYHRRITNQEE